jgi:hypothetical protein
MGRLFTTTILAFILALLLALTPYTPASVTNADGGLPTPTATAEPNSPIDVPWSG